MPVVQNGHRLVVHPVDPAGGEGGLQGFVRQLRHAVQVLRGDRELAGNRVQPGQPRRIRPGDHHFGEVLIGFAPVHDLGLLDGREDLAELFQGSDPIGVLALTRHGHEVVQKPADVGLVHHGGEPAGRERLEFVDEVPLPFTP